MFGEEDVILRDETGSIISLFFGPLGITESNVAEVEAVRNAFLRCTKAGWIGKRKLIVDSDSVITVSWVKDKCLRPWKLWNSFVEIGKYIETIGGDEFVDILREGNGCADGLAKLQFLCACVY